MDKLCASGVDLLPEKSRLSQLNTATNQENLITSHYPPPGIAEEERTIDGTELLDGKFIMLSPAHPPGEQLEPVSSNSSPVIHHEHHCMLKDVDDNTHHNSNAIDANLSHEVVMSKDFYPANQVLDDKQCDESLTMASTNLQTTSLNQAMPVSRLPTESRQHLALDIVVERSQPENEYVDSPLHAPGKEQPLLTPKISNTLTARSESSLRDSNAVIMTQPSPSDIKSSQAHAGKAGNRGNFCPPCGKCRCMACPKPCHLPSCWTVRSLCQTKCSIQQVVDCCTCMCCVEKFFYRIYHVDEFDDTMNEPCACCERPGCCFRWTIMGLFIPVLPCLCLNRLLHRMPCMD